MLDVAIPDLTFPMIQYGRHETPWDLRVLLYKGGAKSNSKTVFNEIAVGQLGRPLVDRIELVTRIHNAMTARLVGGGSKLSTRTTLKGLRRFFAWVDEAERLASLESVEDEYRNWGDYLLNQVRLGTIRNRSAYAFGLSVSSILDTALDRNQPLILSTRLRKEQHAPRAVGVAADKQNLADTFSFGQLCLDVIESLPLAAIYGPLPVKLQFRDGRVLYQWSGLRAAENLSSLQPGYGNKDVKTKVLKNRANWEADRTLRTRFPLVNLRLMAELMVFIGQTGMNLTQAHNLSRTQFSYKSTIDGYEVRTYKARRKGAVLFEIFAEYKTIFNAYLAWRDEIFGATSDRLFPFIRINGALASTPADLKRFRDDICAPLNAPFIAPQKLRNTRVNWLLRQSRNPEITAEQAQHTKQTLLRVYEKPSLHVAQVEIIRFWQKNDPRLSEALMPCPAPGVCDGVATPLPGLPPEAPEPDCAHPTGCLFCEHHRDIDSEDYVWSAACMRFLQTLILAKFGPPAKGKADPVRPIELTVEVLTTKLKWFYESNAKRKAWVHEANEKVAEGDFHEHWRYLIESAEGI